MSDVEALKDALWRSYLMYDAEDDGPDFWGHMAEELLRRGVASPGSPCASCDHYAHRHAEQEGKWVGPCMEKQPACGCTSYKSESWSLAGIYPNITNGMDPVEYVRRQRGEWSMEMPATENFPFKWTITATTQPSDDQSADSEA